jgi:hypothetical protein
MIEIKYKNCHKKDYSNVNLYKFYAYKKNNEIELNNTSEICEITLKSKNLFLVNNIKYNREIKVLLKSNQKLKINILEYKKNSKNKLELHYTKKDNIVKNNNDNNTIGVVNDDKTIGVVNNNKTIGVVNNNKTIGVVNNNKTIGVVNNNKTIGVVNDDKAITDVNKNKNITFATFDWKTYLNNYDDLRNAKINTKIKAWKHWTNIGIKEGRVLYALNGNNDNNDGNSEKKIILHISHNFGGGTQNYVMNMIKILTNYKHYILYVIDNDKIKINDDNKKISDLNSFFNIKNIKCVYIHHLLYSKNNSLYVCDKILSFIYNISCNKYVIIHDYFLLFNNNPNPTIDFFNTNKPSNKDITFTNNLIDKVNKIIFQSKNTYNNYLKYINDDKFFIINNVPDIQIYNKRIYPAIKNKFNIGILGHIHAIHKGRDLAKKIFNLFENDDMYKFYIFGTFDNEKFNNLIVLGEYKNNEIYDLLKKYKIDFFLNISIFEETYSYTLSIELNTGLPIVYNNIGSYSDRLKNYSNCYGFDSIQYYELKNIFSNIIKECYDDNNTSLKKEYNLIKNLPEINYLIENNNDYPIHHDEYITNVKNNICVFIIIKNEKNLVRMNNLILDIIKNIFYDKIDYIFILSEIKIGYLHQNYKVKLLYYSNEIFYSKIISEFTRSTDKNLKILLINIDNILDYDYFFNILIDSHVKILEELKNYDVIGFKNTNYYIHWWSSSKHIKLIDLIDDDKYFINNFNNTVFSSLELHYSKKNSVVNYKDYLSLDLNAVPNIYGIYFICCIGNYLEIVKNQIDKLIKSELYLNTKKIICFVCLYTSDIINLLEQYEKIEIIKTDKNLYEKFAINNFKKYIYDDDYLIYYIHSKSVSRKGKNYDDWRFICDYFTIEKWKINVFLLNYYDCIGINLRFYPKIHFSGNFWWSKSNHINLLNDVDDNYLSPEMYVCSKKNTNYICLYNSFVRHDINEYDKKIFIEQNDEILINNTNIIPEYNFIDKYCLVNDEDINFNNFNSDDYFELYKREFKINDKKKLYEHFINHGIKENRLKCFNVPNKKNIIIITSKIYVSNNKFSYSETRSIYNPSERFNQVINTISSIKKYIPDYFIILLDNSKFSQNESESLEQNVNIFLNPTHNSTLKYYTDECIYKAYGELNQTKILINCISYLVKNNFIEIINLFKITGRYLINDDFNYNQFNNKHNIFKINENVKDRLYYFTCFYKISNENFDNYSKIINQLMDDVLQNTSKYDNLDYEVFFPPKLNDIKKIDYLGITQNIAVWQDTSKI